VPEHSERRLEAGAESTSRYCWVAGMSRVVDLGCRNMRADFDILVPFPRTKRIRSPKQRSCGGFAVQQRRLQAQRSVSYGRRGCQEPNIRAGFEDVSK